MQIWYPGPEVRDDGDYPVRLNPGSNGKPFAVITLSEDGHTALVVQSAQEADRLDAAAAEAKRLLSPPVPADHDYVTPAMADRRDKAAAAYADGPGGLLLPADCDPDNAPEAGQ